MHTHTYARCVSFDGRLPLAFDTDPLSLSLSPVTPSLYIVSFYSILRIFMRCNFFCALPNRRWRQRYSDGFFLLVGWWLMCGSQNGNDEANRERFSGVYTSADHILVYAASGHAIAIYVQQTRSIVQARVRCLESLYASDTTDVSSNIQNSHAYRLRSEFFMELL